MTTRSRVASAAMVLLLGGALCAAIVGGRVNALADAVAAHSEVRPGDLEETPPLLASATRLLRSLLDASHGVEDDGWPHEAAPGLAGLDLLAKRRVGDRYEVAVADGGRAVLTLAPRVQERLDKLLRRYRPAHAGVVVMEVHTGRVLGFSGISARRPEVGHLTPLKVVAPSASVFKIITAAALLERGWDPERSVCYSGGLRRLRASDLLDNPARDHRCADLEEVLARSVNTAIGKMALSALDPEALIATAEDFGFNRRLPFDLGLETSPAKTPETSLELARTAAGFDGVRLSTVHGAMLAAAVASGGIMRRGRMVEEVWRGGERAYAFEPEALGRALSPESAARLAPMMHSTTLIGTARAEFRRDPELHELGVAGKTGSLRDRVAELEYSWFVGFAPADAPQYAVAAMVGNEPLWHIRAPYLAREALAAAFD